MWGDGVVLGDATGIGGHWGAMWKPIAVNIFLASVRVAVLKNTTTNGLGA